MSKLADTFDKFLGALSAKLKRLGLKVIDAPYLERDPDEYMALVVFEKPSQPEIEIAVSVDIGVHERKKAVICSLVISDGDDTVAEEKWAVSSQDWADISGVVDVIIDEIQAEYAQTYSGSLEE